MAALPSFFVENRGQIAAEARYYVPGAEAIFFTDRRLVFARSVAARPDASALPIRTGFPADAAPARSFAFELELLGANGVRPEGREPLVGRVSFLRGGDPSHWQTGVATFAQVVYPSLYGRDSDGGGAIDLVYRLEAGRLKYEFVVHPGARPEAIALAYSGIEGLHVDAEGRLVVRTAVGTMIDAKPLAYQVIEGRRVSVTAEFAIASGSGHGSAHDRFAYGFEIADYDPRHVLVIDPGLAYSTMLGGNYGDFAGDIAVDGAGSAYVIGRTASTGFPTTIGAFDTTIDGAAFVTDAFIAKLDPSGAGLVYATFLGGSGGEYGESIAVDAAGAVYVTGRTASTDFPTTEGAFQRTYPAGDWAVFVAKLDPAGAALEYSTFLGSANAGAQDIGGKAVTVDGDGCAYVTGSTMSAAFPTTAGAFDTSFNGGLGYAGDAFVTKLAADGSTLLYSTFLGGMLDEGANGIAIDAGGNAYVVGWTRSADFPVTTGAFDTSFGGAAPGEADAFITKLNPAGTALVWSTFLGASGAYSNSDYAADVAVHPATGEVYVAGDTGGANFPATPGAFSETRSGSSDVFLTVLSASGASLVYSTFLGGPNFDEAFGIALGQSGDVYMTGSAYGGFPTTPGAFDTTWNGYGDAFVAKLRPAGLGEADMIYSTYLGGSDSEWGKRVTLGPQETIYVVGSTYATDFPTTPGVFDATPNGGADVFVTKLVLATAGGAEICTGGMDEDGDTLVDCADPECCLDAACAGHAACPTLTADLIARRADLASGAIGAGGVVATLDAATLETLTITSGPYAGKGFFGGEWAMTIDGTPLIGTWLGALFVRPGEARITLAGALTGGMRGTMRGFLTESQEGSGVFDRYAASWDIVRVGDGGAALLLEAEGAIATVETTPFPAEALAALQTAVTAQSSGDYDGPLATQLTRIAVASPGSPYFGRGFTYLSYASDAGNGEAWTSDRLVSPGHWEMSGLIDVPLTGTLTGLLDESRLPRTLAAKVERAALPPLADLELRVVAPRSAAAGQTVDYLIEYRNDGVLAAEDVVVVAQLPGWAQYVTSTAGGVYRPDTHETIWKLGTVAPRGRGALSVKATFFWELPQGTPDVLLAMYESASPEKDYYLNPARSPLFDHASYLAHQPLTSAAPQTLAADAFASERAADPSLDDVYRYAVETGYQFLIADRTATSDGSQITRALMADAAGEIVILQRVNDRTLLAEPLPDGLAIFDRTGGMGWDIAHDHLAQWGTWAVPGSPTPAGCVRNCVIKKVPRALLKQASKTLKLALKSWNCFRCVTGRTEEKCVKCIAGLQSSIPLLGEAIDFWACRDCCERDPNCGRCTEDKIECGKWSPSFDSLDAVHVWRCNLDTGEYAEFSEEHNCGYTPVSCCIEGVIVPGCKRVRSVCRDGLCRNPDDANVCGIHSFCEPASSTICPAKDPNAKQGPAGAVAAGERLDYEVELENVGLGIAYGVYVTDVLDEDLDDATLAIGPVVSAADGSAIAPAGEYDPATRTVAWFVGELGPGAGGHMTLSAAVRADAPLGTEIVNYATVYFPSVPEVTPTNPVVSWIPLEQCANGLDDDANGVADCDDPACDGACAETDHCADGRDNDADGATDCADMDCPPCPEECANGVDDDGDGEIDCVDAQCCGDSSCVTCGTSIAYAKGVSQVGFRPKGKSAVVVQQCVDAAVCAALNAGAKDVAVTLNACAGMAVPAERLTANRKRTVFKARSPRKTSPVYALTIDCAKRRLRVSLKTPDLDRCLASPCQSSTDGTCAIETCLRVDAGMRVCAAGAFMSARNRDGTLARLKLKSLAPCLPPK